MASSLGKYLFMWNLLTDISLMLLSDICLHDGVLLQQYDWKPVNVYRSFWDHTKWWVWFISLFIDWAQCFSPLLLHSEQHYGCKQVLQKIIIVISIKLWQSNINSELQWCEYCPSVDVPVWSKLESGQLPSMQQLVQILDNEMKMNVQMDTHHHS